MPYLSVQVFQTLSLLSTVLLVSPPLTQNPSSHTLTPTLLRGIGSNFLTGSIPAMATALKSLNFQNNYITSIATHSLNFCNGRSCCLSDPSKCSNGGTFQRSAAACAICGTTDAVDPFCWGAGGECVVSAGANIAAGTVNSQELPSVPLMLCSALLSLKASLGVTFTSWAATVPCQVVGKQAATQTTWSGVLCGDTGDVLSISLARQSLKGSIHADISKLTALTYL
ncbi:unnamed protein product [Closterium sp. Naga37s-1]|nr:unnamed protein product [Closterium sp. Naga37s-1]